MFFRIPAAGIRGLVALRFPAVWGTVFGLSLLLLPARLDRVRHNHDIGHADGVAYSWQARNLAAGKGWNVPYVTNFFHRYDTAIDRPDDQWPPLLSFALAIAFHRHGTEANVARMTTVVISTVLLPLALCLLVQAVTGRAWPGLFAPVPVWFSLTLLNDSFQLNADQMLASVLCLFLAALLGSRRFPFLLWLCGPLLALAWYGKGSQIVLFPFLLGAVALLHGPRMCLRAPCLGAILLALLCMSPRLRENVRDHGNALHSTQSCVSAFFGLSRNTWSDWEGGFYSIFWNRDLPGLRNRFDHPALHARSKRRNTAALLRPLLAGLDAPTSDWPESELLDELPATLRRLPGPRRLHLAALLLGAIALFSAPVRWMVRLLRKRLPPEGFSFDPAAILFAFVLFQGLFVILFWEAMVRLLYPALIPALALPWAFLPVLPQKLRFPPWSVLTLNLLACLAFAVHARERLPALTARQEATFRHPPSTRPRYPQVKTIGDQMAEQLPADTVIMCRNPWQTLWYAPETFRAVGMPYAHPPELFAVARYYGVTHLLLDRERPGLRAFLRRHPEAFEAVFTRPRPLYKIHWDKLDTDLLTPIDQIQPLWDPRENLRDEEEAATP